MKIIIAIIVSFLVFLTLREFKIDDFFIGWFSCCAYFITAFICDDIKISLKSK